MTAASLDKTRLVLMLVTPDNTRLDNPHGREVEEVAAYSRRHCGKNKLVTQRQPYIEMQATYALIIGTLRYSLHG